MFGFSKKQLALIFIGAPLAVALAKRIPAVQKFLSL